MKRILSIYFASILGLCSNVYAGIPVFDGVGLVQSINQVLGLAEQLQQLEDQFDQIKEQKEKLQDQLDSVTGSRGLGNIYNDPNLQNVVPSDAMTVMSGIASQGTGLTSAAQSIRNSTKIYNCEDLSGQRQKSCLSSLNFNAQKQAYAQNALAMVSQRVSQIQSLQDQISYTSDPKQIAELQARLQAEMSQVANDANRIEVMRLATDANEQAINQQRREKTLKWLSQTGDGSGVHTFPTTF